MKLFSLSFEAYKVIAFVDEMDKCYRLIEGAEKSLDEKYKIML